MSDKTHPRAEKKHSRPALSLTRTFFGKTRPGENEILRYPRPNDNINLGECGGRLCLNDGAEATLKELIDISVGGVVLFAYPKAYTPGCTKQVCLFRDAYLDLTTAGFAVYGLSRDSVPRNASFSDSYRLPFRLICDKEGALITALGLNKKPNDTMRAVIVLNKSGKVLASMVGNPSATLEYVAPVVQTMEMLEHAPEGSSDHGGIPRMPTSSPHNTGADSFKEAEKAETKAILQPNPRRNRSLDREDFLKQSPSPTAQTSSLPTCDYVASRRTALPLAGLPHVCLACGHNHENHEVCSDHVITIHNTLTKLQASGVVGEAYQRELANKLALVAGELALVAATVDAQYREEQKS